MIVSDHNSEVMTEEELIDFLRIREITNSKNPSNVILNLRKNRGLPCVHICKKCLYVREAITDWLRNEAA